MHSPLAQQCCVSPTVAIALPQLQWSNLVTSAAAGGVPVGAPPVPQLIPLHRLVGHTGPVTSLTASAAWPGLLLSTSADQTLRGWLTGAPTAAAGGGVPAVLMPCSLGSRSSSRDTRPVDTSPAAMAGAATPLVAAAAQEVVGDAQCAAAADNVLRHTAPVVSTAAGATRIPRPDGVGRYWRQFVLPEGRSFLPPLPDVSDTCTQQQALIDVVALAAALHPPPTSNSAGATPNSAAADDAVDDDPWELLRPGAAGELPPLSLAPQQTSRASGASAGIAAAFQDALGDGPGRDYSPGSWLPTMTSDVPQLLVAAEQAQGSGATAGADAGSGAGGPALPSLSQLGMLRYIAGDAAGMLAAATAAGAVTPEVVALAAAGGGATWRLAAALAAARLAGNSAPEAAALHLTTAGDHQAAEQLLRQMQQHVTADALLAAPWCTS